MDTRVTIIGAGLSGLTLAYLLKKESVKVQLVEARSRYGGRIYTLNGKNNTPMEMGATWLGEKHLQLNHLLDELQITRFAQHTAGISLFEALSVAPPQQFYIPDAEAASYRISGGSNQLIDRLVEEIDSNTILLNTIIDTIKDKGDFVELKDREGKTYHSSMVVSTLPPQLLMANIHFEPALPSQLVEVCNDTPTWMGESIKFVVEYARPFWKEKGFSGAAFSNSSIASEIHDHSNADQTKYALKGFLKGGAASMDKEERKSRLFQQLRKYFGSDAADYLSYEELIWSTEPATHTPIDKFLLPHQNSGHPLYEEPAFNGKLFLSGSETSSAAGGYMNGAVAAAYNLSSIIIHSSKKSQHQ